MKHLQKNPKEILNKQLEIYGQDVLPYLIEVELINGSDSFLKAIETLQRIGYSNFKRKELHQFCFILHQQGKYYISHFKCLNMMEGSENLLEEDDIDIQISVASLLEQWGIVKIINKSDLSLSDTSPLKKFKILQHKDRSAWNLIPLYEMKKKRNLYNEHQKSKTDILF